MLLDIELKLSRWLDDGLAGSRCSDSFIISSISLFMVSDGEHGSVLWPSVDNARVLVSGSFAIFEISTSLIFLSSFMSSPNAMSVLIAKADKKVRGSVRSHVA